MTTSLAERVKAFSAVLVDVAVKGTVKSASAALDRTTVTSTDCPASRTSLAFSNDTDVTSFSFWQPARITAIAHTSTLTNFAIVCFITLIIINKSFKKITYIGSNIPKHLH